MKLPNYPDAIIPPAKITDYLLSFDHPDGRSKARFFRRFGFQTEHWEELAQALRNHVANHDVAKTEGSPFGTRYVIEGIISTPDGRTPLIRTVWFIEMGEQTAKFVTAYPLQGREND
jgi:hypothetical protein